MSSSKLMFSKVLFLLLSVLVLFANCGKGENKSGTISTPDTIKYSRFRGSYKSFNDLPELHLEAAQKKGIVPMQSRSDTLKRMDKLIKIAMELDMYKIDELKYSMPFLVEDASKLLIQIGLNFKDSLRSKKMAEYKLIVTSVTRTQDDVAILTRRNSNASDNSAHCYGTTFDISWRRFEKIGPAGKNEVSVDKLKLVLGQVLHDLRERGKCYIIHERKQACFHITVR